MGWGEGELDAFFAHAEYNPEKPIQDHDAHIFFFTERTKQKMNSREETPIYMVNGCPISAQRIAWILFRNHDPRGHRYIRNECAWSCINPFHSSLEKKS
jgi:hypothetical protein